MRFISTKTHGVIDYIFGILVLVSPWLFNFSRGGAETIIPVIVGIAVLLMAMMTNYELGLFKIISMNMHLNIDVVTGIFVLVSPWLFGFSDYVFVPHVIFGLITIVSGLMTEHSALQRTETVKVTR